MYRFYFFRVEYPRAYHHDHQTTNIDLDSNESCRWVFAFLKIGEKRFFSGRSFLYYSVLVFSSRILWQLRPPSFNISTHQNNQIRDKQRIRFEPICVIAQFPAHVRAVIVENGAQLEHMFRWCAQIEFIVCLLFSCVEMLNEGGRSCWRTRDENTGTE